jgi:hypothetical protein
MMLASNKMLGLKSSVRVEVAGLRKSATKLGSSGRFYSVRCNAQAGKKQQASDIKQF